MVRMDNYKMKKRNHQKRSIAIALSLVVLLFFLLRWTYRAEKSVRITPSYEKENIEELVYQEWLAPEDYEIIYRQTGLGASAVDMLRLHEREEEILQLQNAFFASVPVSCEASTVISREESMEREGLPPEMAKLYGKDGMLIPYVEAGDILISFNAHVLGWRNGHAAIVVDSEERITLEARVLGTNTKRLPLSHWYDYPSFVVLRLKGVSKEEREAIAEYASEHLFDLPYQLSAGIWSDKAEPTGTHCAHLVWYAYRQFGYDLDSDGGRIVTPRDIFESPLLEVVQIYGMEISK